MLSNSKKRHFCLCLSLVALNFVGALTSCIYKLFRMINSEMFVTIFL